MSLKKFLKKHSGELSKVAGVLGAIVNALPIDRQDKRNLGGAVDDLISAAGSIARSADKIRDVDGLTVDEAAVKAAVVELLPGLVNEIAERVFKLAKDDADKVPALTSAAEAEAVEAGKPRQAGAKPTAAKARKRQRPQTVK
jgi:hypothetical protein